MMKRLLFAILLLIPSVLFAQSVQRPVECGKEIQIVATPNTGYHFVGWHDGNTQNPRTIKADGNIKYSATFELDRFNVVFLDNDGISVLSQQSIEYGKYATAPVVEPSGNGDFIGWSAEGLPAILTSGQINLTPVVADIVYTAMYNANTDYYTVQFTGYKGEDLGSQQVEKGGAAIAPDPKTPDGYKFGGWNRDFTNVQSDMIVKGKYGKIYIGHHGDTEYEYIINYICE